MHGPRTPLIEARSLEYRFGPRTALCDVDLQVGPGEIHGLLGPRGAGKTTLLRVLHGSLRPSAGWAWAAGAPALVEADDARGESWQRMAIARTLASGAKALLVDEPAAGFDAPTAAAARLLIARHAELGGATVWATRRLDSLRGLASGVTLLAGGRVRYSGSVELLELRALAGAGGPAARLLDRAA